MSDVATDLDTIEIDLGVIPLYHCTFITIDEVVVDALLAQPILGGPEDQGQGQLRFLLHQQLLPNLYDSSSFYPTSCRFSTFRSHASKHTSRADYFIAKPIAGSASRLHPDGRAIFTVCHKLF